VPTVRVATWNVNSLKARMPRVEEWLAQVGPDVLCLQETKSTDKAFPAMAFSSLGYESVHHGEGRWNGVAIVSRVGIDDVVDGFAPGIEPDPEARLLTATCGGVRVATVYVPNGRHPEHPDFAEKLTFLDAMVGHATTGMPGPLLIAGDVNVAPSDLDLYDPQRYVGTSHTTPRERAAITAQIAERKEKPPRIRSGKGAPAPRAWPTVMVKMTKLAPIRMLAFWSAIAESWK